MKELYSQTKDAAPSGNLARPAPPGRRRVSSRNVSRASSTASPHLASSSPSMASVATFQQTGIANLEDDDGEGIDRDAAKIPHISLQSDSDPTSEIPLEEVEVALAGMSREDLVLALKRAKEQMDILDADLEDRADDAEMFESSINELRSQVQALEAECQGLRLALRQREDRVDELMREQDREEDEVYANIAMIERLRRRLEESEKEQLEMDRRYQEHVAVADKERQSFLDMESLLQTQKTKASIAHERLHNSNQELSRENDRLQSIVSQLRKGTRQVSIPFSHKEGISEWIAQADHAQNSSDDTEIAVRNNGIRSMQAEVEASEVEAMQAELLAMAKSQDMLTAQVKQYQTELMASRASNIELRDQNEAYMNILQEKTFSGALLEESSMLNGSNFNHSTSESSEADDVDDVPDEPKRSQRKRAKHVIQEASQEDISQLTSLASELETDTSGEVKEDDTLRRKERKREKSEALGTDINELHREIRTLRESNQALTLYVNKILDRIISVEGYENVLSADVDDKAKMGSIRGGPNRKKSQRFRQPIGTMTKASDKTPEKKTGGMLSFISPTSEASDTKIATTEDSSSALKARRTASYDWRSLLGGASSTASADGKATDAPRKISSNEEVEDAHDVEEKEKIRRSMVTAGITLPENQLKTQKRASTIGTFFTRVLGSTTAESVIKEEPEIKLIGDEKCAVLLDESTQLSHKIANEGGHEAGISVESKAIDLQEARQKALDVGSNANLTKAPQRSIPLTSRRERLQRSETSIIENGVGETTFESVGGDESFRIDSPPTLDKKTLTPDMEEDRSWSKTFKRMSIIGGKVDH